MNGSCFSVDGTVTPRARAEYFHVPMTQEEVETFTQNRELVELFLAAQAVTAQEMYEAQYVSVTASLDAKLEELEDGENKSEQD